MQQESRVGLEGETIQRLAKEVVKIDLTPTEVDGLKSLLNGIGSEIEKVTLEDRSGSVSEMLFRLEEWS